MNNRYGAFIVVSLAGALMGGCVSSGTYQAKEQETQLLNKNLEATKSAVGELQEKSKKQGEENETLKALNKKLESDIAELKGLNEKLNAAAKPENLLKTLGESLAALQAENASLKQALAEGKKSAASKEALPAKTVSPEKLPEPGPVADTKQEKSPDGKNAPSSPDSREKEVK
jgi:DNA repair exonuclease SbcCD ATPase subunit